jgi:uncharacterized protein (TIGR02996 family)
MERELRPFLAAILSVPDDQTPRLVFADWLEDRGDPRAREVRKNCETGYVYLRNYTLSGDGVGDAPSVAFLVVQFVPQPLAIEFGCRCATRALPVFHREWPNDDRPSQLVATVSGWLRGERTKKQVHQMAQTMGDLTGDAAAEPPAGETWDRDREMQRYQAVCAARSVVNVAIAVRFAAKSAQWPSWVCQCAMEAIGSVESRAHERSWQRQELLRLIGEGTE